MPGSLCLTNFITNTSGSASFFSTISRTSNKEVLETSNVVKVQSNVGYNNTPSNYPVMIIEQNSSGIIEMRIEEEYYPPESDIKPEYIEKIKKIHESTIHKKGKIYNSMEEFLDSL